MNIRLGCVRLMRFYYLNHRRFWILPMHDGRFRRIPGWDFIYGRWHVQVAWYWWGFGVDR